MVLYLRRHSITLIYNGQPINDRIRETTMKRDDIVALSLATMIIGGSTTVHAHEGKHGVPALDHVFVIMMENHNVNQILGNTNGHFD